MIIVCPGCRRRYALDDGRLGQGPCRLRCCGCKTVFDHAPEVGEQPRPPEPRPSAPARTPLGSSAPLVLIADENRAWRARLRGILESIGCQVAAVTDGEQAFRFAVARRPRLMIVDAKLRKLSGLAVCEGVKGSPDLKGIRIALVGAVAALGPEVDETLGAHRADGYLERTLSPVALRARLEGLAEAADRVSGGQESEAEAQIRRLARIMLSDLKIYDPARFHKAVAEGKFLEVFRDELRHGRELIARRFPDLPNRIDLLTVALREGLEEERPIPT